MVISFRRVQQHTCFIFLFVYLDVALAGKPEVLGADQMNHRPHLHRHESKWL